MSRSTPVQKLLATLMALMGLLNVLSSLLAHDLVRRHALQELMPLEVVRATRSLTLLAGCVLLVLARGLWRGKRMALWLSVALLGVSALLHLLKGLDWEEAGVALLLAGLLLHERERFVRRSDPPSLRRLPLVAGSGLLFLAAYGAAGFLLLPGLRGAAPAAAVREFGAQAVWSDGPLAASIHGHTRWFLHSLGLLSGTLALWSLWTLLRPVLPSARSAADRRRAAGTLRRLGGTPVAAFAVGDDKQYFFGRSVDGVVAFRAAGGIAVALGDPIAAPCDVAALLDEFAAYCVAQDWGFCLYEAGPEYLAAYRARGMSVTKIGEDACIELPAFGLGGSAMADVRHAVSKAERNGLTVHMPRAATDKPWAAMQALEAQWRARHCSMRLGFTVGELAAEPEDGVVYTAALDRDGNAVAMCSFLSCGAEGWTLDVMRRADNAPNGAMEFLLARSLEHLRDIGATWCSLGVAPLANLDPSGDRLLERVLGTVYSSQRANAIYRYQSLFRFKAKFHPCWEGAYLVYAGPAQLPAVLAAVAKVLVPQPWRRVPWLNGLVAPARPAGHIRESAD